jgi:ABC-type transporter Mla maintaining outer membrane lipid asymmetry permease subunit MlaE
MNARELARQVTRAGALALPIAAIGAALAGAAWSELHADAPRELARLVQHAALLGPVVALLLVAAPLAAAQAGEIGALREGQQIAWLLASGRSVLAHVVAARVVAAMLVLPLAALVAMATLLGVTALGHRAGAAPLAGLGVGDLVAGAWRAAAGGAALGLAACATGLLSRAGVAHTAARAAAVALAVAAGLGLAMLAGIGA